MRRLRLIMVPITISWFAGVLWWISHRDGCGCGTSIETNTQRVVADPNIPASPTMANEAAMEAAIDPGIATDAIDPVLLQPIVIPFVKNQQGAGASAEVAQYAEALKAALLVDPSSSILVAGHTDADGDAELNKRLSKERAEVIKARLVGCGISEDRIRATGMGADEPIADNLTSKGKAKNRRVEITIQYKHETTTPNHTLP